MISIYKKIIHHQLKKIKKGSLVIVEPRQTYQYGNAVAPQIEIRINDMSTYKMLFQEGILGAGTAYMKGFWQTDKLAELIQTILENSAVFQGLDHLFSKLCYMKNTFYYLLKSNNLRNAKRHILAHYDLSNEFFECFLDKHMMYSCAIFDEHHKTLDEASDNKLAAICQKLKLTSSDYLLEIGTGWGGLAIYAAKNTGCQVTTTTISEAQYEYVKQKLKDLNLEEKITLLKQDYRTIQGKFDKVVSIEMIEAVGHQYYKDYFSFINQSLKENGLFLLQAITINDNDYERAKNEVDFIKKYIFPGGCLPSLKVISQCVERYTQMSLIQLDDIGLDYVITLKKWQETFQAKIQKIKSMGFDDEFINKWNFYFAYCQAGFMKRHISDIQGLWIKQNKT